MTHKSRLLAAVLLVTTLAASGCWDRIEIENRGYVLGAAVDHALDEPGRYDLDRAFQQAGNRRYRLSYEMRKLKKTASGEKSGQADESIVFSTEGEALFPMSRAMRSKTQLDVFLEDMQVLLVSEEVAREGIREIFDFFIRYPGMRRRATIFVTKGRAEDFLKRKPKSGELNSIGYGKLTNNAKKVPTMATISAFEYFSEAIRTEMGFLAPLIYMENDEVKVAGAALFNSKGQMVGIGNEYETVGGKIWRGKLKQGLIVVASPTKPATLEVFEIFESKITVKPEFAADTVRFIVEGEFSGSIGENMPMADMPMLDDQAVNTMAQAVASELTGHTYAALKKLQTIRADTLALGDVIRRENPRYWEQIKDRWEEEIFPTVEADVRINVKVRGSGMTF